MLVFCHSTGCDQPMQQSSVKAARKPNLTACNCRDPGACQPMGRNSAAYSANSRAPVGAIRFAIAPYALQLKVLGEKHGVSLPSAGDTPYSLKPGVDAGRGYSLKPAASCGGPASFFRSTRTRLSFMSSISG